MRRRPSRDAPVRRLLTHLKVGDAVGGEVTDITLGSAFVAAFYKIEGRQRRPIDGELLSAAVGYRVGKRGIILPVPEHLRIHGPTPYGWGSPVTKDDALAHAVSRISFALFGDERSLRYAGGTS